MGLGLSPESFAQPARPWRAGLQLYTVRDGLAADLDGTLRRIAEIGYREVETAGLAGTTIDIIRDRLRHHKLGVPSMHAGYDELCSDLDAVVADAKALGAAFVVCPSIDAAKRRTAEDWKRVCRTLNEVGHNVRRHGVTLAYHNHDFEFIPLSDGTSPFALMMAETDPAEVKLELDVYWLAKAGLDPVKQLSDYRGRVALVHLKDLATDGTTAELGAGVLDFEQIVRTALGAGVRHLFVEQDDSRDPLHSIVVSRRYLDHLPLDIRP